MNIGDTITRLRKEKMITQEELASACSITQAYLSQIENNKKEPTIATLQDISKILGVPLPVVFFLSLENKDVPKNKQAIFNAMKPTMDGLFESIFHDEPNKNHK